MTDDNSTQLTSENLKHSLDQRPEYPPRPPKIQRTDGEGPTDDDDDEEEEEESKESVLSDKNMSQKPRLQRYLVAIEYIGTRFAGAQKQPNCRTVVGVLEEAFHKFIGQPVSIFCSSRTDAGVHALSNVCHVDVERISKRRPGEVLPPHEPAVVRRAVNHFLQKNEGDITVIDVRCVPPDFHARYKAQERTYFYRLLSGPEPLSTFEKDWAWHVPEDLDLLAMRKACKVLVGRHDFSSFRAASCQAKSPIRTLDELSVTEVVSALYFPSITEREQSSSMGEDSFVCSSVSDTDISHGCSISSKDKVNSLNDESCYGFGMRKRHRCYVVTARARSFLYHQVRLLVGVLKSVGTGELTISDVERILNAKNVTAASPMAPACGLFLGNVKYDLSQDLSK
ncbi:tRNA pseudouridine(38-40) synthase [Bertholletia excelsa]